MKSVCTALKPGGIFILRCFTQPEPQERADQVFEDALRGAAPNFNAFRLRLLSALQPSTAQGIATKNVYREWAERRDRDSSLVSRAGWSANDLEIIEGYRNTGTVFTFPTLAECRETLSECFQEISVSFGTYDGAERCPRLVLKPRRSGG